LYNNNPSTESVNYKDLNTIEKSWKKFEGYFKGDKKEG